MDLWRLAVANRVSRRTIVDPESTVVICTTTHGKRIERAHLAIESVARGSMRPRRHMLWLDDPALLAHPPRALKRLQRRGLEILGVAPGYRVHTKYYPYVASVSAHEIPLATHEDDIIYPPNWLHDLVAKHKESPEDVVTYRAHTVALDEQGIGPYASWTPTVSSDASYLHFGTTVSGQLYPPAFLDFVRERGDAFRDIAPTQDDVWLHHLAVESGYRTTQVTRDQQHFPFVPGTQAHGLFWINVAGGQNDVQIQRTYTANDVARLLTDAARASGPQRSLSETGL